MAKELTQQTIGKLLYREHGDLERDAIHIAVAPVSSDEQLKPGTRIKFAPGSKEKVVKAEYAEAIGIVDPFLDGDTWGRFWMFMLPNTITGLRHVWTHPAFEAPADKSASQAWIEEFAAELDQTYSRLMEAAEQHAECGDWTYDNSERYKRIDYAKWPIFWAHYEVVTGKRWRTRKPVPTPVPADSSQLRNGLAYRDPHRLRRG